MDSFQDGKLSFSELPVMQSLNIKTHGYKDNVVHFLYSNYHQKRCVWHDMGEV